MPPWIKSLFHIDKRERLGSAFSRSLLFSFCIRFAGQAKAYLNIEKKILFVVFCKLIIQYIGYDSQMVIWHLQQRSNQTD